MPSWLQGQRQQWHRQSRRQWLRLGGINEEFGQSNAGAFTV